MRIWVSFGHTARTLFCSSLCSSIHSYFQVITAPPTILSAPHTQQEYQLTLPWQCQLSARATTGGMWGLGPEITKRLKIDPGNGDVAFPNPLTSNPSHICLYCLACFTRGVRLCGLRRMRMLWRWRGSTQGPKVTLSLTCVWQKQVKDPFYVWMLCRRPLVRWTLIFAATITFNKLYISSSASAGSSGSTIVWLSTPTQRHEHQDNSMVL